MRSADEARQALTRLFRRQKIADLDQLFAALRTRSRMTVFRRLSQVGYLSSSSHAGRYYTLRDGPQFDPDGLWQHAGVLFSRDGTLKETVVRLVQQADAGQFHRELQRRVRLRVHNTLADLIASHRLGRAPIAGEYLYVSANRARAATQLARRAQLGPPPASAPKDLEPAVVIEVLVEVIHGVVVRLDAQHVAARLVARGVAVTVAQVEEVFRRHGVVKKRRRRAHRARGVEAAGRGRAGHGAAPPALDRRAARLRRRAAGPLSGLWRGHARAEDHPAPRRHPGARAVHGP